MNSLFYTMNKFSDTMIQANVYVQCYMYINAWHSNSLHNNVSIHSFDLRGEGIKYIETSLSKWIMRVQQYNLIYVLHDYLLACEISTARTLT